MADPANNGGPSLLQVMYDSIAEIRKAVEVLGKQQSEQLVLLERQAAATRTAAEVFAAQTKTNANMQEQIDALDDKVSSLQRIGWILTIIGGVIVAVAVGVTTEAVNKWIDRRDAPTAHSITTNAGE